MDPHPRGHWPMMVTNALDSLGGTARLSDIYEWYEHSDKLTDHDLALWTNGVPNYQHAIRSCIARLKREGRIEQTDRGRYRLRG